MSVEPRSKRNQRLAGELAEMTAHVVVAAGFMLVPCLMLWTMTTWTAALGTWLFTTVMAFAYGQRCWIVGRNHGKRAPHSSRER